MMDRRTLLRGLMFVAAAPAIVRATSLMPVKAFSLIERDYGFATSGSAIIARQAAARELYDRLVQKAYEDFLFNAGQQWEPPMVGVLAHLKDGSPYYRRITSSELYRS